ncbi:MAG: allantoinase AllB [Gemmatimonadaceae bacterium]
MPSIVFRSRRVLTPNGMRAASVHVSGGVIQRVSGWEEVNASGPTIDVGHNVLMPGLVDTHVHINDPGRTEWEGFESATRAAAAGGVTTLLDMPLNSIPATVSVADLETKRRAAEGRCLVNVGFIGGVVPGNAAQLQPLHEAGVRAFKCFLVPSGVDEFPAVDIDDLRRAMPIIASFDALLMVHAELPARLVSGTPRDPRSYAQYLASRPDSAETQAIAQMIMLASEFGARVHIVHVSSRHSLPLIAEARARGVRITAETCPHYLCFAAEEIADGATAFKCAPPIRSVADRDALWWGLEHGVLDAIVSDHSPSPPALKCLDTGDFHAAWGGIASLQLGLPAVWRGAQARGIVMERVVEWMSAAPAQLADLGDKKGSVAAGFDADLTVWDPDADVVVIPEMLHHRHSVTPYLGAVLRGAVLATYVAGREVFADGRFASSPVATFPASRPS